MSEKKGFVTVKDDTVQFKEYKIKGINNRLYSIVIFQKVDSIIFSIKDMFDYKETIYKKEVLLEEFYNLNRFFRQYISIEELFSHLFNNLKNNEISLYAIKNNIKLSFLVECRGTVEEIPFILLPQKVSNENMVKILNKKVNQLDKQKELDENFLQNLKQCKELINNGDKQNENIKNESYLSLIISIINYFKINTISLIILISLFLIEWIIINKCI